jgi:ABC-type branched-subunit amino acid transport system substrate-binding protein
MLHLIYRAALPALCATMLAACATGIGQSTPQATSALGDAGGPGAQGQTKPVKIGLLLPLSGFDQSAVIGKGLKQAGEMALFELDNPNIQLLVKDDKGTPIGAAAATDEAIREGAEIIIGPLTAKATAGASPLARQAKVPILTFSNDRQIAGNGVYLMSFLAEQEIDRIVAFAASKGKRSFAALIPDDAYGKVVEPAFRSAVTRAGGRVAAIELYPLEANAMLDPAKRVMEAVKQSDDSGLPVDALLIAGGPSVLPRIAPLVTYSGIDTNRVKLLGTGAWDYPNAGREPALVGGWYAGADPHGWQAFSSRFAKSFGTAPPRLASLAYDAVSYAVALSSAPPGQRYTVENLTRASGFNGVDGPVRFLPSGLSERGLAVLEVQTYGTIVADPAPGGAGLGSAKVSAVPGQNGN